MTTARGGRRTGAGPEKVPDQPRSWEEQYAAGKALRTACPRKAHAASGPDVPWDRDRESLVGYRCARRSDAADEERETD